MSMSTPAFIGRLEPDGKITGIRCHNDGYIECVGSLLEQFYSDRNKVDELIKLGSISCLGPEIGQEIDFDKEYDNYKHKQCIAYHRDRHECIHIYTKCKINELCSNYLYVYIYDDNDMWTVYYDDREQLLSDTLELFESEETESSHKYLVIFDDNDYELCNAQTTHDVILQMADHTGCKTELFENALSGMKTDKQQIELFNKFSITRIDHIFVIANEIGVDDES